MKKDITILVVDDQRELAEATVRQLLPLGHHVYTASSAEEALAMFDQFEIDLVLTDLVMPGMDGYELCRSIEGNPALEDVYVVLISGKKFTREDILKGLEAGAKEFLVRPVQPDYLRAKISAFIQLKQTEESLRESNQNFLGLSERSPNMIFIEKDGKILYVNRAAVEILGYDKEDYYQDQFDFLDIIAPEFRELAKAKFDRQKEGHEVKPYEFPVVGYDGRYHDSIIQTKRIEFNGEEAILGILTDITEKKVIQNALQEAQHRLNDLAASIPGAVYQFLIRPDGYYEIPYMSESGEALFERPMKELMDSQLLFKDIHPGDLRSFLASIENAGKKAVPWSHEFRLVRPGGRIKWIRGSSNPRRLPDGGILYSGVLLDISERKRIEFELEKYQTSLEDLIVDRTKDLEIEIEERTRAQQYLKEVVSGYRKVPEIIARLEKLLKAEKNELAPSISKEINSLLDLLRQDYPSRKNGPRKDKKVSG